MSVDAVTLVANTVSLTLTGLFVVLYSRVTWNRSQAGVSVMVWSLAVLMLLGVGMLRRLELHPVADVAAIAAHLAAAGAAAQRIYVFAHAQRDGRTKTKTPDREDHP